MYSETINLAKFNPEINSRFCSFNHFSTCTLPQPAVLSLLLLRPSPLALAPYILRFLSTFLFPSLHLHHPSSARPTPHCQLSTCTLPQPAVLSLLLLLPLPLDSHHTFCPSLFSSLSFPSTLIDLHLLCPTITTNFSFFHHGEFTSH